MMIARKDFGPGPGIAAGVRVRTIPMGTLRGTLRGFPNPPALWLRWAKPTYANAITGTPAVYLRMAELCTPAEGR